MKTGMKIGLAGCGGILILLIIAAVIVGFYINSTLDNLGLTAVMEQARTFGKTTNNQGCMDEGLKRAAKLKNVSPDKAEFWNESAWTGSCLETSATTPGFCNGVPSVMEELKNAAKGQAYDDQMCKNSNFGKDDIHCKSVYSSKQKFCWGK